MKTAEFADMCRREWMDGRGDLVGLSLTNDSLREFSEDVIANPLPGPLILRIPEGSAPENITGISLGPVVNPVTRSDVEVAGDARVDAATVRYMGPSGIATRTVAI